jgi:hypothetical protein
LKSPECHLPELPGPLPDAVGMARPDGIFVSKSDWAQLVAHDVGMRDWIAAAAACLTVQR